MAIKDAFEKDLLDSLRDVRKLLATLSKNILDYKDETNKVIQALITSLDHERSERRVIEAEEAKQRWTIKQSLVNGDGNTTEKISKEVTKQLNTNRIDYSAIIREKVVPALLVAGALALFSSITGIIVWVVVQYINR